VGWMIGSLNAGGDSEFFSSPLCPDRLWDLPILRWVRGDFVMGVGWLGCGAGHSPHLLLKLESGAVLPFPNALLWHAARLKRKGKALPLPFLS